MAAVDAEGRADHTRNPMQADSSELSVQIVRVILLSEQSPIHRVSVRFESVPDY